MKEGPDSGFTEAALELVLSPSTTPLPLGLVAAVAGLLVIRLGVLTRGGGAGVGDGALLEFWVADAAPTPGRIDEVLFGEVWMSVLFSAGELARRRRSVGPLIEMK